MSQKQLKLHTWFPLSPCWIALKKYIASALHLSHKRLLFAFAGLLPSVCLRLGLLLACLNGSLAYPSPFTSAPLSGQSIGLCSGMDDQTCLK